MCYVKFPKKGICIDEDKYDENDKAELLATKSETQHNVGDINMVLSNDRNDNIVATRENVNDLPPLHKRRRIDDIGINLSTSGIEQLNNAMSTANTGNASSIATKHTSADMETLTGTTTFEAFSQTSSSVSNSISNSNSNSTDKDSRERGFYMLSHRKLLPHTGYCPFFELFYNTDHHFILSFPSKEDSLQCKECIQEPQFAPSISKLYEQGEQLVEYYIFLSVSLFS